MRRFRLLGLCLVGALPVYAAAPVDLSAQHDHAQHAKHADNGGWTSYPVLLPGKAERGDGRATARFVLKNLDAPTVHVQSGDLAAATGSFPVSDGKTVIRPAPRVGNYHWVQAREESAARVVVAATVRYFSNPGPAPAALLRKHKSELELIPLPLPREHAHFREGERAAFLVRFNNEPLGNALVHFESEHGSRATDRTDANGFIAIAFPRDFPSTSGDAGAHHGTPKAQFVVAVEHDAQDRHYLTSFNYVYAQHASTGKSQAAGIGFVVLGGLLATPLLRRKKISDKGKTS